MRVSEQMLEDFINGRLEGRELENVLAYIRKHPSMHAQLEKWRAQNGMLATLGEEILDEPVPERLKDLVRRAKAT